MLDRGYPIPRSIALKEPPSSPEAFAVDSEYARCIGALNETGIVRTLPQSEKLGVLGIDGQEYKVPTLEQVEDVLGRNRKLVEIKGEQGFTRLQLTPFAVPLATLADRVGETIVKHARLGKIVQAKHRPGDPDVAVEVNIEEPISTWEHLEGADISGSLVYLPSFSDSSSCGLSKQDALRTKEICAVPGWSIALVEKTPFLPQTGKGEIISGRTQLETNKTFWGYLTTLKREQYKGETGFTPEDFLIKFVTRLVETNQVSYDWNNYSAAWLVGIFQKNKAGAPVARWDRGYQQVYIHTYLPDCQAPHWGAPTTVRLT